MSDTRLTADEITTLLEWHAQLSYDSRRSRDEPLLRKLEAMKEKLTHHEIVGTWETLDLLTIFCSCGWSGQGAKYKAHIEEQKP